MDKTKVLQQIAKKLRIHSLMMTSEAGSGHPTTCLSMAELAACLFFDEMQYNIDDPSDWSNDELVLSKGHAAPILWAAYAEAGIIPTGRLKSLRKITSSLEGHPTPRMKWVKAATGSLGQGMSVGVGMAAVMKRAGSPRRVYVVMGDGECAEGSVWEAANSATGLKLNNLCAIIDINRLGQSQPTQHQHDLLIFKKKFEAFGWNAIELDGHDIDSIRSAFASARKSKSPSVLLAKTLKGKGISFLEDLDGWHGKPLNSENLAKALAEIGPMPELDARAYVRRPKKISPPEQSKRCSFTRTRYTKPTATRKAYGNGLLKLGGINPSVVCIDGDVKNSTYAEDFMKAFPERSYQAYIAEQNMVGMGIGMAAKGYIPFMATFSAFLGRAHDQIRMAAYSRSNIKLAGSHAGVSIGEDGPSQMGLEDLAIFTPIPGCIVLYPSDAYAGEACLETMARCKGMAYIRTTRPATPILYDQKEKFPLGGSKILKKSKKDAVLVVGAGITVFEALKAYDLLQTENISIRIMDAYSIKPFDVEGIRFHSGECGGKVVVVEDHFPSGGLGSAAAQALAGRGELVHLAVTDLPRSGKPDELLDQCGISAARISETVRSMLK